MISNKKDFLKFIKGAGVGLYGAPTGGNTVKFQFASSFATAVANKNQGAITFVSDANGYGAIYVNDDENGGTLVSSKIQNISSALTSGNKHGQKTVTITYIDNDGATQTDTFDVIDETALEAYFTGSKTIDISTGDIYEVKTDGTTILVDANDGLKSGLKLVYVPASPASGDDQAVDAHIALSDNANTELYTIPVANIVGNGILDHSSYDKQKNELHLFFKTAQAGVFNEVVVPVGEILDINDIFIKNDSSIYLTATADTSVMNLGVLTVDPSTAAADNTGLADAWKVKQYVDSKSTDLAVSASGDNYVDASVDANNNKKINVAATDKTKTAVALAETAVQNVVEGTSAEGYVKLNISTKSDASVITITTDDSDLSAKITEIDASIDNLQAKDVEIDSSIDALQAKDVEIDSSIDALQAKDVEIDASIDRLDASVTAIETAIEGMDADLTEEALDSSIVISLKETNGKVTAIGVTATKATVTFDNTGATPNLTAGSGLLAGDAIAPIKQYVDKVAEKGFDGLDSQITETEAVNGFVVVETGIVNGLLADASSSVTVTYGDYDKTNQTNGIATTGATKTYVDAEITAAIQALDLANDVADSSAHDTKNYVKTVISESNGIVKNESVTVTYGDYTNHTAGVATVEDTSVFVQNQITTALTWTIL